MKNINHKGLYVKRGNMGLLETIDYSHIYLDSLNFKE